MNDFRIITFVIIFIFDSYMIKKVTVCMSKYERPLRLPNVSVFLNAAAKIGSVPNAEDVSINMQQKIYTITMLSTLLLL